MTNQTSTTNDIVGIGKDLADNTLVNNIINADTTDVRNDTTKVSDQLAKEGFSRVDETFIGTQAGDIALSRSTFLASCADLPADSHASAAGRNRRYGNFVLHPWSGHLESIPPIWDIARNDYVARYLQSALINTEHDGLPRSFAPLTELQRTNFFLRWAMKKTFSALNWPYHGPVIIGVHIIQLVAHPNKEGISSPNVLHQDGEPFTWAFLLNRVNVSGGENIIARPEVANQHPRTVLSREILARFTLEKPFEGWVANDKRVSHYVSPVAVAGEAKTGFRTVLLIDFSPAVPSVN